MQELPRTLKIVTVWALIVTALFVAAQWWLDAQAKALVRIESEREGAVIVLTRARDGHYHWPGTVGGVEVDFLLDTGASRTSVSQRIAAQAGLVEMGQEVVNTANGQATAGIAKASVLLQGGVHARQHRISVMRNVPDDLGLLGMDVLGKLKIEQQGGQMRISLPPTPPQ